MKKPAKRITKHAKHMKNPATPRQSGQKTFKKIIVNKQLLNNRTSNKQSLTHGTLKMDLHVHTWFSKDSFIKIKDLVRICRRKRIIPAITDHNTLEGVVYLRKKYPSFKFIPGIEISTKQGHLIAYYVNENIQKGLSFEATLEIIKEHGGISCAPHALDSFRSGITNPLLLSKCDLIESYNSRTHDNSKATGFANINNKVHTVGSDAHFNFEIGQSYVTVKEFDLSDPYQFFRALNHPVKFVHGQSPFYVHGTTTLFKYLKPLFHGP